MHRWGTHELFYKTLYEKRQGPESEYKVYLNGLNSEELRNEGIYIPGVIAPFTRFEEGIPIFSTNMDIAVWKHSRYTPPYLHSHEYFEIVCVMEGKAVHRIDEKVVLEMMPGDICILPDSTCHSLEVMEDNGIVINLMLKKSTFRYTFFDILSADNMLSSFFRDAIYGKSHTPYLYFRTAEDTNVRNCIETLFLEYYTEQKYCDKILYSMAICLFSYLLRDYEQYFVPGSAHIELEIFEYLKAHYEDATLVSVAQHFNYSPTYFSRMIHKITGETFSELMNKHRMEIACRLLRETNMKIGQICETSGFNNQEYFNRLFKKMFKKSPTQYRKEKKNAE